MSTYGLCRVNFPWQGLPDVACLHEILIWSEVGPLNFVFGGLNEYAGFE